MHKNDALIDDICHECGHPAMTQACLGLNDEDYASYRGSMEEDRRWDAVMTATDGDFSRTNDGGSFFRNLGRSYHPPLSRSSNMPVSYKRDGDFRALVPKSGPDSIGVTYDRYKGVDMLECRVWRSSGTQGEYLSTRHGLNMTLADSAYVYHYIQDVLNERYGDADDEPQQCFKMYADKVFVVRRQEYCGKALLAARVYLKQKDGTIRPTSNGLTARPSIWAAILPSIKATLEELLPEWGAIVEELENAVFARLSKRFGSLS